MVRPTGEPGAVIILDVTLSTVTAALREWFKNHPDPSVPTGGHLTDLFRIVDHNRRPLLTWHRGSLSR